MLSVVAIVMLSGVPATAVTINGTSADDEIFVGELFQKLFGIWYSQGVYKVVNGTWSAVNGGSMGAGDQITVNGSAGDDYIEIINATEGSYVISSTLELRKISVASAPGFHLNGGADDDVIRGSDGDDAIEGSGGVDTLSGRLGDDVIIAVENSGNLCNIPDSISSTEQDVCIGDGGDDRIFCFNAHGLSGNDVCGGFVHSSCTDVCGL